MRMFLPAGQPAEQCYATPCCAIFSPWGYEQFPFFTSSPSFWERWMVERRDLLPSSLPSISLPTQQSTPAGQHLCLAAQLIRSPAPPPPPSSRGGRPVSAKPIVKQRPKMCFPTSSPSLTSKHSDRPWKNVAKPSCRPAIFAYDDFHRCRAASSAAKI